MINPNDVLEEVEQILNDPSKPLKDAGIYLRIYHELIMNIQEAFKARDDIRADRLLKIWSARITKQEE